MRYLLAAFLGVLSLLGCHAARPAPEHSQPGPQTVAAKTLPPDVPPNPRSAVTEVEMHNVIVHEDASFKLQIRWLRGQLLPERAGVIPSFDDKSSMLFQIDAGIVHASTADLTELLNRKVFAYKGSPLSNVKLTAQGTQIKLTGTLHKGIPLPIAMLADLSPTSEGHIRVHPTKLSALHVPVKAILGGLGIHIGDLIDPKLAKGVTVDGNDVILNLDQMMPPPRQRGKVTAVHVSGNDVVEIFGSPRTDMVQARRWKNFIACKGGTLRFGKLTMNDADLIMIDNSADAWFDFFLDHYQEQVRAGNIKMSAANGLEVYMPGYSRLRRR